VRIRNSSARQLKFGLLFIRRAEEKSFWSRHDKTTFLILEDPQCPPLRRCQRRVLSCFPVMDHPRFLQLLLNRELPLPCCTFSSICLLWSFMFELRGHIATQGAAVKEATLGVLQKSRVASNSQPPTMIQTTVCCCQGTQSGIVSLRPETGEQLLRATLGANTDLVRMPLPVSCRPL
jgi:hypothetical protein